MPAGEKGREGVGGEAEASGGFLGREEAGNAGGGTPRRLDDVAQTYRGAQCEEAAAKAVEAIAPGSPFVALIDGTFDVGCFVTAAVPFATSDGAQQGVVDDTDESEPRQMGGVALRGMLFLPELARPVLDKAPAAAANATA